MLDITKLRTISIRVPAFTTFGGVLLTVSLIKFASDEYCKYKSEKK